MYKNVYEDNLWGPVPPTVDKRVIDPFCKLAKKVPSNIRIMYRHTKLSEKLVTVASGGDISLFSTKFPEVLSMFDLLPEPIGITRECRRF